MNTALTARQARFVEEFLVDCNGASAAVRERCVTAVIQLLVQGSEDGH